MTWSIIAKDPETGAFGVAVTTKFFAVGALTAHGVGRLGALATQAYTNPLYGRDGLRLLSEGRSAEETVATRDNPAGITDCAWIDRRAQELQENSRRSGSGSI